VLLSEAEFVAFDLETSSLHRVSCRIVEFDAVRWRDTTRPLPCATVTQIQVNVRPQSQRG
jgi:hypothetical protein